MLTRIMCFFGKLVFYAVPDSYSRLTFNVMLFFLVIFKVYDVDYNGKVSFKDILEVLRDLTGSYMSDDQREV